MPSFSHSKIGSFDNCRLQFKFRYIDRIKVKAKDTIETFLGIRVHEALEKFYRDLRYEKLLSLEELLDFYNKKWEENWEETIIIAKKEYSPENYYKMGRKYLRDYYKNHKPFDEGRILGLETQNYMSLDENGDYKFHIRIDRLMDIGDGVYEVHDYKTNMVLPTQEELDSDKQLAMYSLWVRQQFQDFKKVRLVWHFLAFDKDMESYRTAQQLEELKIEIMEKIKEIEATEDYSANVSHLCNWCLYKEICPMWKHEVQLEEKPANEFLNDPGVKLVNEYVKTKKDYEDKKKEAEEKLGQLKQAIIEFCKKESVFVIFSKENKITIKETESFKFPGKNTEERIKLEKALKKIDRLEDVLSLDTFAMGRILKNKEGDEELISILREFGIKDKGFSLNISKK